MNINSSKPPERQGPNQSAQHAQNVQKQAAADQKAKAAEAANANGADRVDISGRSKEIADIMSAVNELPEVRNDRVQEIKKSIEAGTYTVDSNKVAGSILKSI
jgi:negative regulator of flagellin synthesis FlgM